mmetsp:Transcript_12338/g.32551  ORF Transcript_12338/g.32551 Transcript_12338/m.32551 type:complete len:222 (+) Transcript_12338:43-708(+)
MLQARCNQLQKEALAGPAPRYLSFKAARTHVPAKAALINRVPAKLASVQHALNFPSMPKRCMRVKAAAAVSGLTEATPGKIKLGFAGIGIMGNAMVANLIRAGYEVHVWNRNAVKCEPLVAMGAKAASSPAELAAAADYTFAMLADPQAALEVAAGSVAQKGIVAGLGKGKGYIDVSTIDAGTAKTISSMVRETGAAYLEAPVSGSKKASRGRNPHLPCSR